MSAALRDAAKEVVAAMSATPDVNENDHPEGLSKEQVERAWSRWDLRQQAAVENLAAVLHSEPSPDPLVVALAALWECGVASGMDTDGDAGPGAMVAGMGVEGFARAMVNQVEQLRADYDACLEEPT